MKTKTIIMVVVAIIGLLMIIFGQRTIGYQGLFIELIGLFALLCVLFVYNRDHK